MNKCCLYVILVLLTSSVWADTQFDRLSQLSATQKGIDQASQSIQLYQSSQQQYAKQMQQNANAAATASTKIILSNTVAAPTQTQSQTATTQTSPQNTNKYSSSPTTVNTTTPGSNVTGFGNSGTTNQNSGGWDYKY